MKEINITKAQDIYIQDQTTDTLSLFLAEFLDTITLPSNVNKDQSTFQIETSGVTPVTGNYICLQENKKITQEEILSVTPVSGNIYNITIAVPLDYNYTTAGGCTLQNVNLAVDGSTINKTLQILPKNGKWDITRMLISMVLTTAGDDGKFGNITALTNGVYFRKEDGENAQNLFNAKENSDFAVQGYDLQYITRSGGGGDYGLRARISFNAQDKRGVVIRLNSETADKFVAVVRDNLTGISRFRVILQGHIVED